MIRRDSSILAAVLLLALVPPALAATKAKPAPAKSATAKPAAAPAPDAAPADPLTLQAQARAAATRGDNDLAIVLAEAAIVADPSQAGSYDALGDVYAAQKQPDFARDSYQKALDIDPTDTAATQAITALDRAGDKSASAAGETKSATP